jgi:hypothetical protein
MTAGTVELSRGSTGGPSRAYQYREAGHTWLYDWDPRETQLFVWALLEEWDCRGGSWCHEVHSGDLVAIHDANGGVTKTFPN